MQTEMSVTFCVTAPGRHPITLRPDGIYRFRCKPAPPRSPVDAHLLADVWYSTKRDGTVRDHKSNEFFGVVGNAHAITIQPDPPTAIKIVSTLAADSSALQFIFGLRQLEPADDFRWTIVPKIPSGRGYIVHPGLTVNVLRVKWPLNDDGDRTVAEGLASETATADNVSEAGSEGLYDARSSDGSDIETEAPDAEIGLGIVSRATSPKEDDTGTVVSYKAGAEPGDRGESGIQSKVLGLFENLQPANAISTAVRNATLDKQSEAKLNALFVAAGFPTSFVSELTNAGKGSVTDVARNELARYEVIRARMDPGLDTADSPLNALRTFMSALNNGNFQLLLLKASDDTLAAIDEGKLDMHEPGEIVVAPIIVEKVRHELTFEGPVQSEEIDIGDGVSTTIGLTGYGANVGIGSGKVLAEVDGITFKGDVICTLQWEPNETGDDAPTEDDSSKTFSYEVPYGIKKEDGNPFKELYTVIVSKQFPYNIRVIGTLHLDHWKALGPRKSFGLPLRIFYPRLSCTLGAGEIGKTFVARKTGLELARSPDKQLKYGGINVSLGHFTKESSSALKPSSTIAEKLKSLPPK